MRFDYQPALTDIRIFKTSKQRKLFLYMLSGIFGLLIIFSFISYSAANYSNKAINTYSELDVSTSLHTLPNAATVNNTTTQSLSVTDKTYNKVKNDDKVKDYDPFKTSISSTDSLSYQSNSLILANNSSGPVGIKNFDELNNTENSRIIWNTIKVQSGDNLISLLQSLQIPAVHLKSFHSFIKTNVACKVLQNIKPGQSVKVLLDENNNLKAVKFPIAINKTLLIEQFGPKNYKIHHEEKQIIKKLNFAHNKIVGSFYAAAQTAGLDDALIMQIADIFGWDIDFSMDIRPNDKFRILYEEKFVENEKIDKGHIIAAEFINQGQIYQAIRFVDTQGRIGYYTPEGYSMNKTFLRNPVKFTRIGSKFSINRHHPILHRIRAHKGVDYVAPSGTPVKAAGDGRVILIGRKGGYGNVVELLHGNKYSTLYAHLSNFAKDLKKGAMVKQGQVIGYVGRTGLATGDHLHYEFRVDGIHRDPLTVQLPKSMPLSNKYRPKFLSYAQQMISLLNENDTTRFAKS
jgi:murein DD-endopeptidase MepM/ murein hydrolase activator NlpD